MDYDQVRKQLSSRKQYYEEEPLSDEYDKTALLADFTQNSIDIKKDNKMLSLTIENVFVPINAIFLDTQTGEDEYNELDITDYQQKYFKFVTQENDHRWNKQLDNNFMYYQLKYRPNEEGNENASAFVSYKDKLAIYQKFRHQYIGQVSFYLIYGSKKLSNCIMSSLFQFGYLTPWNNILGMSQKIDEVISFPITIKDLPPGVKIGVTIWQI